MTKATVLMNLLFERKILSPWHRSRRAIGQANVSLHRELEVSYNELMKEDKYTTSDLMDAEADWDYDFEREEWKPILRIRGWTVVENSDEEETWSMVEMDDQNETVGDARTALNQKGLVLHSLCIKRSPSPEDEATSSDVDIHRIGYACKTRHALRASASWKVAEDDTDWEIVEKGSSGRTVRC